jgi:hypothetical protein
MESKNPANKNTRSDTGPSAPLHLQLSTPDPHEDTKPVRIALNNPAARSEITQAVPALTSQFEDTKPVQVHAAWAEPKPAQIPEPTSAQSEELPDWLIAFAHEDTPVEAPANPEEDTRTVQIQHAEALSDEELSGMTLSTPALQAADDESGWTLESTPEPLKPEIAAERQEDLPESEVPRSEEIATESSDSAEALVEPTFVPKKYAPEDPHSLALATALDEGSLSEAGVMLTAMKTDPAARASALSVLRSRLDLRAESQPLWEFYAELCSADNQPGLARQALETEEKLKNASGEEYGTIAGIG